MAVTYYTVSDHRFFLGTVAMLNSLRITGNEGELVVLDMGLTDHERDVLRGHASLVMPPEETQGVHVLSMKPYPLFFEPSETVVLIDSDMIVTDSLDSVLEWARAGKICVCPAWTEDARTRWFPDWEVMLELRSPLRREDWVHNGFVVLEMEHWPDLFQRWWEVCGRGPEHDADALNALFMSEISRDALHILPQGDEVFGGAAQVVDARTLACTLNGRATRLLHYPDNPKPWEPSGWLRLAAPHYVRLMRRLLFANDVTLRVEPRDAPVWLRPSSRGELALRCLGGANRTIVWTSRRIPEPVVERLRRMRRKIA